MISDQVVTFSYSSPLPFPPQHKDWPPLARTTEIADGNVRGAVLTESWPKTLKEQWKVRSEFGPFFAVSPTPHLVC